MKITAEHPSPLHQIITINIEQADYKPKVDAELKRVAKQVALPGFRPGKAPMGMVQRMYSMQIMNDEINSLINTELEGYIDGNKLKIFGYPLPIAQEPLTEKSVDLQFKFEIGIIPEINLNLTNVAAEKYQVEIDQPALDALLDQIQNQFGSTYPQTAEATDTLSLTLTTTNAATQTIKATIPISEIHDQNVAQQFVGKEISKDAALQATLKELFGSAENANKHIEDDHIEDVEITNAEPLNCQITRILRAGKAELNQELYDRVFGEGAASSEQEFVEKVRTEIAKGAEIGAEQMAVNKAAEVILSKNDFDMPDEFLMRLFKNNETKAEQNNVETDYPDIVLGLKRTLVVDKILADAQITITQKDLVDLAAENIAKFFAQYGIPMDEERSRSQAITMLKNEKTREDTVEEVKGIKLYQVLKEQIQFTPKAITYTEFEKISKKTNQTN